MLFKGGISPIGSKCIYDRWIRSYLLNYKKIISEKVIDN